MANSPFDILLDKTSILEVAANGTVVGTLATSDADAGDTFTYELLDNAGGRFSLVNGNQIAVADNSLLNYQSAIFHTIKVKTTDSTGLSYEKDINIGLIDAKRNLVGYWKLDETTGSFDNASFVNGNNDGTTQGSLNLGREGLLDEGVGFGGGRVNLGKNLLNYQPDNSNYQFTVAAWIKPTNLNDNQAIFAVDTADGGSDGFSFGLSGNQLYVYVPKISRDLKAAYTIGGTDVIIRATIPPDILVNQWFHVALTYNTDYTRTIYINGVKIASENWTQQKVSGLFDSVTVYTYLGASDSVRDYLIGAQDSNGGARFVGDIDEVRVYNKSLSQSDIVGVMEETNFAPKNLKLSNNAILATSITDGTFVGSFTVQDSILDAGKHTYSLVDDAGGLVGINNNRLVIKNASLLDYANNPNPTIKVRATDPANNITEQEFTLQLIPEERDNINQSLVAYYKLDEKSNDNYKLAVVNSSQYKKPNAGLFAQYFEDGDLTKNILTRIDPSINFFWNGFAPEPGLVSDFGALWRGQITAPTTGEYTFYFKGDEAALFINDQELLNTFGNTDINNEFVSQTINLQAGQAYDFEMEYYDGAGAGVAQLSWAGPGIEAQLVPANAFSVPPSLQNAGLFAEYFNDQNLTRSVLTRTDFGINFNWSGSPDPGVVNQDYFSVRWTGKVIAPVSGEYTFFVRGDNGVRLWVNGQQLVDAWQSQSFDNELTGKITLQEDQSYDFKLEYYEGRDTAAVQVAWEAPGITKQVIDGDYFSQQVNSYSNQASGYYTGTLNPVTKLTSAGPLRNQEGIYSTSAKFSQGNYIDLKINDSDLQYDKQFTVMGWIKPQNFKDWQYIFSASRKDTPGMALALSGKGFLLQTFIGGDPYVWQPFPDSTYANEWNHIAVTHNDGNIIFYLNGTQIGTAYQSMNFAPDWQVFTDYTYLIGALTKENAGDTNGFKGNIDEFRFYNQTLTDTQITEIIKKYNSGPSDIKIASNVISTDTADGSVIGKLDTVGIPLDKGQYTYELLDDAGGKFALSGDQIILKNKSLLSYLDKPIETIKIKSTNTRGQTTEKEITIQLIESEPENGLKAYYKLDESNNLTTKQTALDSSGNNKNGFYNAGVVEDAQTNGAIRGEEGIDGTSASFNSWQDYINLGNQAITYNDQFTVSTWIRPSTLRGRLKRVTDSVVPLHSC